MSTGPFRYSESLQIAVVDFVSPDEIKVVLDIEAPESVALNAGGPRPFPRVNTYVLIPVDDAHLVGQIEWLTVERSAFPKRKGMQDFGLVDLPYPLRKMSLNPLGTLRRFPVGIEDNKTSIRILATFGLDGVKRPANKPCNRTRLPAASIPKDRQMSSEQAIRVDAHFRIRR